MEDPGIALKDIKEEKVIASCIAPWIPPACRSCVVNTEHLKSNTRNHSPPTPQLVKHLESLHSVVIQGHSECHIFEAVPSCSGGKVFKNCHHQVFCRNKIDSLSRDKSI